MTFWQVYLRDRNLERTAELRDYRSLDVELVLNDGGKWTLVLPGNSPNADLIAIDNGTGIILVGDGQVVMSGPAEATRYRDDADGPLLEVNGIDDTALLAHRLCYPCPPPDFNAAETASFTGGAEAAMRSFVETNAITGVTHDGRAIPFLVLGAWSNLGPEVTVTARFDNLLDILRDIGNRSNLRFQIRQSPTVSGQIEFIVTAPNDRSALVRFGKPWGNVAAMHIEHVAPTFNSVVVGGEGKGTGRAYQTWHDGASTAVFGVRETFIDLRQTTDTDELFAKGLEELAKNGASWSFAVEPLDTSPTRFLDDWNLGDRCTVTTDDETLEGYVSSVSIGLSADGEDVRPTVTTLWQGERLNDAEISVARRVGHLERTAEMWTTPQLAANLASTFAPEQHGNANHSTDFAPTPHDSSHHSASYAPTPHDSSHHSASYAPTPHDSSHHSVAYQAPILGASYIGNGVTTGRQIALGTAVRFVILYDVTSGVTMYVTIHADGSLRLSDVNEVQDSNEVHLHATDGFVVGDGSTRGNESGDTYVYVAIP